MNALWVVPPLVLTAGMVWVAIALRDAREAAADLHASLIRFGEVRAAMSQVREEAARSRETIEALHHR